jgi:hypothetical protein
MNTTFWGPDGWVLLHSIAYTYPENPKKSDKEKYNKFYKILPKILPCKYCRSSLIEFYNELPLEPALISRDLLTKWIYDIHNKVNEKLRCQGFLDKPNPSLASVNKSYKDLPFDKNSGLVGKLFIYSTIYNFPSIVIKYPTVKTLLSRFIKHLGNVYPDCRFKNGLDVNIFKMDNTKKQLKCLIRLDYLFRKSDNINQDCNREYDVVKVLLENNKVKQCRKTCRKL